MDPSLRSARPAGMERHAASGRRQREEYKVNPFHTLWLKQRGCSPTRLPMKPSKFGMPPNQRIRQVKCHQEFDNTRATYQAASPLTAALRSAYHCKHSKHGARDQRLHEAITSERKHQRVAVKGYAMDDELKSKGEGWQSTWLKKKENTSTARIRQLLSEPKEEEEPSPSGHHPCASVSEA